MSIQHTVVFTLTHSPGSSEEQDFLSSARKALAVIPGVTDFTINRQVSAKSHLQWQFSMVFADRRAYDGYNSHPDHVAFVEGRWKPEVAEFQEYDFVAVPSITPPAEHVALLFERLAASDFSSNEELVANLVEWGVATGFDEPRDGFRRVLTTDAWPVFMSVNDETVGVAVTAWTGGLVEEVRAAYVTVIGQLRIALGVPTEHEKGSTWWRDLGVEAYLFDGTIRREDPAVMVAIHRGDAAGR